MLKRIIGFFIVFSPFTSYFAISSWLRFPVILILLLTLLFFLKSIIKGKQRKELFMLTHSDLLLSLLLLVIIVSLLIHFNVKGINYTMAYGFSFIMYFLLLGRILDSEKIDYIFVLKMMAISSLLCGSIIISDWILVNLFDIGFRNYFVKVDHKIANMLYYNRGFFLSVGGVAEEPGSMALMMNVVSPAGLIYWKLKDRYWIFMFSMGVYLISLFFLFSVAGFVCAAAALTISYFLRSLTRISFKVKANKTLAFGLVAFIAIITLTILIIKNFNVVVEQVNGIVNKAMLNHDNVSAEVRSSTWQEAILNWKKSPLLGNGPGDSSKLETGYHSVYLTLLADTGIISLFIFLIFILLQLNKVLSLPSLYKDLLIIALFSAVLHFAVIGDFYHAPFWILLIVVQLIWRNRKELKSQIESPQ